MNTRIQAAKGYTLIQLLAAIFILGIILAIAIPSYGSAIARAQLSSTESAIFTSLNNAANFSFINGSRVVMCPSRNSNSCENTFDWSQGWITFEDRNGNHERDEDDKKLDSQALTFPSMHVYSSRGRTRISFQSGGGNFGSNVHFKLCDERNPARSRSLFLSNTGRMRVAQSPKTTCNS
jgi:type IV fimbrial biogenesis protein FimT